jgi:hypothetical protein
MAGKVAFHIGDKGRNPGGGEAFDQTLQGDCFARSGRAGDQPVAVGAREFKLLPLAAAGTCADEDAVQAMLPSLLAGT